MSLRIGNAWGFTFFADDLRDEVGGKKSVMGLYQSDLLLIGEALPFVLPKFVIMVEYFEEANSITSDLKFRIEFPGSESTEQSPKKEGAPHTIEVVVKRSEIPKIEAGKVTDEGDIPLQYFRMPFVLSPFVVAAEGDIKVRCHYDDGSVLKLGRLKIALQKPVSGQTDGASGGNKQTG